MPTTIRGRLAAWLQGLPGITKVKVGTFKVGGHEFPAAQYTRKLREGAGESPDLFFYVVGERPPPVAKGRVCFRLFGSPYDWHVACHYTGKVTDHQPFGSNWMVTPWTLPQKIDEGEKPYRRTDIEFTEGEPDEGSTDADAG